MTEAPELEAHRALCARCHATWERYVLLDDAIAGWKASMPAVDFAPAVVEQAGEMRRRASALDIRTENRHAAPCDPLRWQFARRHRAPRQGRVVAALLAAGLVACGFLIARGPHFAEQPVSSREAELVSDSGRPAGGIFPRVMEPPQQADAVAAAESVWGVLAESAAVRLDEFASNVMPTSNRPQEPSGDTGGHWLEGLEHRWRPVGQSLGDAFDFLWQAGQTGDSSRT